jgi:tRNA 2-thiouridine synthesizing protein D
VKILLIVNQGPWSGSLATTAQRIARALLGEGLEVAAVFFREDGVYHALAGRATDHGATDLTRGWLELARQHDFPLLLCSSAAQRRLEAGPAPGFSEAGLVQVLDTMSTCERVVCF